MSQPADPPQHAYRCYLLDENDEKKTYVGGSYDNISAVTIACAMYQAMQGYNVATWRKIVVFDSGDTPIAFIGGEQNPPPTQTAPVTPTLGMLEPDSSGNWSTEVRLLGTGFT